MTSQLPDIMILDGEAFELHTTPLREYFERIKWRPACMRSTGNYRGYVARWELFGERLFLTGLFGMLWIIPPHLVGKLAPDPDPYEPAQDGVKSLRLQDLFPDQAPLVPAEWVTECISALGLFMPRIVRSTSQRGGCDLSAIGMAAPRRGDWASARLYALVWPERNAGRKKVDAKDDLGDWRVDDLSRRRLYYQAAQIEALRKPCGQTPSQ
jgi:hypothetical protein